MQKIIGLDIGSYSIKAVEILNHFKSFEISNYYENVIPDIEGLTKDQLVPLCLKQLFEENKIKADRIITALPGQYSSSRILSFNFSDERKIAAGVYSELEENIPFDLEQMIVDHQILGKVDNKTLALAVLTKKKFLQNFLKHLQCVNVDPKLVDIDSLSLYNISPYLKLDSEKPSAIIDIGHEKTSICIVQKGLLRMFRSINIGGRFLTEFLAKEFELSYDEAQRLKHNVSTLIPEGKKPNLFSPKGNETAVAEKLTLAFNSIIREVSRTLYSFKNSDQSAIDTVYLSGGTSLLKNIEDHLSHSLGLKVIKPNLESSQFKINRSLSTKKPLFTQGFSIALRATSPHKNCSQINLRKGEFSYIQDYGALFQFSNNLMRYAATLFFVLTASYLFKYFLYTQENNKIIESYKKVYLKSSPRAKNKFSGIDGNLANAHKPIRKRLRKNILGSKIALNNFSKLNEKSPPLSALLELSTELPKNLKISITNFFFSTNGQIKLRVEADSYELLENFKNKVASLSSFSEIREIKTDKKPGSNQYLGEYLTSYNPVDKN